MMRLILLRLRARPLRAALAGLGVAVGVGAIVALLSLTQGLERSAGGLINLGEAEMGLFQEGVSDLTASTLPDSLAERARRVEGVADAEPASVMSVKLDGESLLVFGVRPRSFIMRRMVLVAGSRPGVGQAMVGDGAARGHAIAVGAEVYLRGRPFRVSGIYHVGVPFEDQGMVVSLAEMQAVLERPGEATTIGVAVEPGAEKDAVAQRLERAIPGTAAVSEPGQIARVDTNVLLVRKTSVVIAVLALGIGAIAVLNTSLLAVVERQRDYALLAAVGWDPGRVARLVLGEGMVVSALGSLLGVVLGVGAGTLAVEALAASALVSAHVTAGSLAAAAAIGLATGLAGGLYPAWRATRLPVAQMLSR